MAIPNDEVKGVSLNLTEEDIRRDCADMKIPYSALMAVARRHKAQQTASSIADVLYVMMLAKSKGLNPIADNYSLIPRPGGQGFSLTFNKEAALHVINQHPKVKPGAIMRRFVVTGKGERIDLHEHPEKAPGGWKLGDIDWGLTAICEIESAAGGLLRGSAKFSNCFAAGNDGNPKFLWLKSPTEMTMKQAYKDLANVELDGALPDDDEREAAELAEAGTQPSRALPAQGESVREYVVDRTRPVNTTAVAESEGPKEDFSGLIEKAKVLGINAAQIVAAFEDQEKNGVTLAAFEADLQKEIDARAKAAANPTRTRRAVKAADAPKAEAPAKPKKEPKPRISIVGVIDAISEKSKAFPRKEGEPEKPGQRFLVISINQMDMTVWHKSMFDGMFEAMEAKPQKRVKVGYTTSQTKDDPPREFYEVEEFEILDDAILAPVVPEPGDMPATPEESFAMEAEYVDPADSKCEECGSSFDIHLKTCSHFVDPHAKQKADHGPGSAASSSGSLLFNF